MEDYFELLEHKKAIDFCRFRTTNHKFPIEQGRWDNIDRNFILIYKFIIFCACLKLYDMKILKGWDFT
jgi:hypothetical protein